MDKDSVPDAPTVVFSALTGGGHYSPLVSVCSELVGRVRCLFLVGSKDVAIVRKLMSNHAHLDEKKLLVETDDPYDAAFIEEDYDRVGVSRLCEFNEHREEIIKRALLGVLSRFDNVLGVVDMFSLGSARALRALGARYVVTLPGPPSVLAVSRAIWPTTIGDILPVVICTLPTDFARRAQSMLSTVRETYEGSEACFVAGFEHSWLLPSKICLVRSFSQTATMQLGSRFEAFLRTEKPVILVAGSTLNRCSWTPRGCVVLLEALRRGQDRWRVVWRRSQHAAVIDAVPDSEGDWFVGCDWLPQLGLLQAPQVQCFVSHMGWNGVTEALAHATPMLALPVGGDQALNTSVVSDRLGAAIQLDSIDPTVPLMSMPCDPGKRPPERFTVDQAYNALVDILFDDPRYMRAAREARARFFPSSRDEPNYGPRLAASRILDILGGSREEAEHAG